jgi:hypothetical protein
MTAQLLYRAERRCACTDGRIDDACFNTAEPVSNRIVCRVQKSASNRTPRRIVIALLTGRGFYRLFTGGILGGFQRPWMGKYG